VILVGALPVVFESAEKIKKQLRKNGNFYAKSVLVFGVILKQMTVDTCNFY